MVLKQKNNTNRLGRKVGRHPKRHHNNFQSPHSSYGHPFYGASQPPAPHLEEHSSPIVTCNIQAHVKQNIVPKETCEYSCSELGPLGTSPVLDALVESFSNHNIG